MPMPRWRFYPARATSSLRLMCRYRNEDPTQMCGGSFTGKCALLIPLSYVPPPSLFSPPPPTSVYVQYCVVAHIIQHHLDNAWSNTCLPFPLPQLLPSLPLSFTNENMFERLFCIFTGKKRDASFYSLQLRGYSLISNDQQLFPLQAFCTDISFRGDEKEIVIMRLAVVMFP